MTAIAPGSRLGPYEVVAPLGAGGMGEVWRARDTRLGREVAIKVLPAAFAADPLLRARIEREAKTISSLNHPHICTLHDIGREGETDYLVLELVEGETLALRLARGPLPPAEVLRLGIQIADALERAHRAGIVHRDLKPGNVMITKSGAKLLDFGLARGGGPGAEEAGQRTLSPTMAEPLTQAGHIVGTFQYMAPEQLEGAEPDPRSDLWALGCVLYEMATGKAPFTGGSQASLISSIMKDEPRAIGEVAPLSPPALERAVRQCLAKDPEERWQTAGDLRRELAWISSSGSQASVAAAVPGQGAGARRTSWSRRLRAWALPLVAGAATMGALWLVAGRDPAGSPVRVSILHDEAGRVEPNPAHASISPDGEAVAYVTWDSTGSALWVRRLADPRAQIVARSRGAIWMPFWSPGSRDLAYFTSGEEGRLWRVSLGGGAPIPLAPVSSARGGSWSVKGVILYAPEPSGPLFRVNEAGGSPTQATVLDSARGQNSHRAPHFLPDGDHFLHAGLPGTNEGLEIFVGSLRSGKSELLAVLPGGTIYAEPGFLLYTREGKLVAHRFDARARKLSGAPLIVADATDQTDMVGTANVTASRNGRLAWRPSPVTDSRLEWVDRDGRTVEPLETMEGHCAALTVGPDGRRVLGVRLRASGAIEVIYHDPDRGSMQRVSPPGARGEWVVWAPDGKAFYMSSARGMGREEILHQSLERAGRPELIVTSHHQFKRPQAITPDGRTLLYGALNPATNWDIYRMEMGSGRPPEPLLENPGEEIVALSPDGRILALRHVHLGGREVLLAPIDRPRAQKRVGLGPIGSVAWGAGGRELYYSTAEEDETSLFAIPVDPSTGSVTGPTRLLFKRRGITAWAPAPDGKRFVVALRERTIPRNEIRVDLDWPALARRN